MRKTWAAALGGSSSNADDVTKAAAAAAAAYGGYEPDAPRPKSSRVAPSLSSSLSGAPVRQLTSPSVASLVQNGEKKGTDKVHGNRVNIMREGNPQSPKLAKANVEEQKIKLQKAIRRPSVHVDGTIEVEKLDEQLDHSEVKVDDKGRKAMQVDASGALLPERT